MSAATPQTSPAARRRALLVLAGVAVLVLLLVVGLVAHLLGAGTRPGGRGPAEAAGPPTAALDADGWDLAAETALATRPMPQFPASASKPHALSRDTAGPPFVLPAPTATAGRYVPGGFPPTVEGAIAQLAALLTAGFVDADPQTWAQAYNSVALPGAPAVETTFLYTGLSKIRGNNRGVLPPTGPVRGLDVSFTPAAALVKGITDGGRYVVVCVIGELYGQFNGQSSSSGSGDCQALRYVEGQWRISPGAAAAWTPELWPHSAEAVAAGYRPIQPAGG